MNIYDILSRLRNVEGPDAGGNYKACCPAHEDQKQSLSIKQGDKGIVFKCFAGCGTREICEKLGIEMKDLFPEKPKSEPKPREQRKIVKTYPYTDKDGKLLFEVVRYEPKGFSQRMPDPEHPGKWIWKSCPVQVLYNLPAINAAIEKHQVICVAEGEKDADTLTRLGYVGTTIAMGAGKWKDNHIEELKGAFVALFCDNDIPGRQHAREGMKRLDGIAHAVQIVDLKNVWPEMPEKADVSDLAATFGDEKAKELIKKAFDEGAWTTRENPEAKTPAEISKLHDDSEAGKLYSKVQGYSVLDGNIVQFGADGGVKKLSTFSAIPRKVVTRDDGVNTDTAFEIEGWDSMGRALGAAWVTSTEFPSMGWPTKYWGFEANIMPGNTNKDKLRYAIAEVGRMSAKKQTLYTHTGWRKIGGSWAYLHEGGAIGADDVSVKLEGRLEKYDLSGPEVEARDGAETDLLMLAGINNAVSYPLLATCYLAPLTHWMRKAGCEPKYTLFLLGRTNTGKTTVSAIGLSHFGAFTGNDMPASFSDTSNSVMRSAFLLKDMPIVVDDYYPASNPKDRRNMEAMAQNLSRAFGDHAERGRLNSDMTQRASTPPRGMAIVTGEDTPNINQSGISRYYIVQMKPGDVPFDELTQEIQSKARDGYQRAAMRGYIQWLLDTYIREDEAGFCEGLNRSFTANRKQAQQLLDGAYARSAESVACIMVGVEMMLKYFMSLGVVDMETARAMGAEAWNVCIENSRRQSEEMKDEKPANLYIRIVRELLHSGANKCLPVDDTQGSINVIGYMDDLYYYLMPEITYKTVSKFLADQGQTFPLGKKMLNTQLAEEGIVPREFINRQKKIRGKNDHYLWLPRNLIDGAKDDKPREMPTPAYEEPIPFA